MRRRKTPKLSPSIICFLRPLMNTQKLGWAMTGGKGREGKYAWRLSLLLGPRSTEFLCAWLEKPFIYDVLVFSIIILKKKISKTLTITEEIPLLCFLDSITIRVYDITFSATALLKTNFFLGCERRDSKYRNKFSYSFSK